MRSGSILFFLLGVMFAFQNCGPANFSSVGAGVAAVGGTTGGSNGGFDGKGDFALSNVPVGKLVKITAFGAGTKNPDAPGSKAVYEFKNDGKGVLHMAVNTAGGMALTLSNQSPSTFTDASGNLLLLKVDGAKPGPSGFINDSWINHVSHEYFYKGGLVGVDAFYSVEWL